MKTRSWLALLGFALLAAACAAPTATAPVATPSPPPSASPPPAASLTAPASRTAPATLAPSVTPSATAAPTLTPTPTPPNTPSPTPTLHPLTIAAMRAGSYPGSAVTIESTLDPGVNYKRYIASYLSENLKIYGLLTVPNGTPPPNGWPIIIFNHGFIPPQQYRTTSRYVAYQDWLARSGYITFKSDYRGHGDSQGVAEGGYGSPGYVVDVLNAMTSMEHYPGADASRLGMWGHSMGGYITLRAMVISKDIKVGVIWSGVVGSYPDLLYHWHNLPPTPSATAVARGTAEPFGGRGWRGLIALFGPPETNPDFWNSISATSYLADLSGPLQLHHDLNDSEVPFQFSQTLADEAQAAGQTAQLYSYPGDDHNLANSFGLAMTRTIAFFDKYLKS